MSRYAVADAGELLDALAAEHPSLSDALDTRRVMTGWSRVRGSDTPALAVLVAGPIPAGLPETFRGYPVCVLQVSPLAGLDAVAP